MGRQDEEDPEDVAYPGEGVQHVQLAAGVLRDEKVQEGQPHGMAGEPEERKRQEMAVTVGSLI